ncbi:hypothetical protein, partial [Streptomyces lasiicapitis]|uniref:hypothetical protein n=1 Tax=Streptomyces lasiicapitis TaxID=1923961 RepID=UPI00367CA738
RPRRGPHPGYHTGGLLAAPPAPAGAEADGVAVAAQVRPGDDYTLIGWVGDCRAYGWNGVRLKLYSNDHTVGDQLRANGAALELAEQHDNWLRTSLSHAAVGTVYMATIPDPLVILTSDGVHDQIGHTQMEALVRDHAHDPQALADALVAAAEPDDEGYRDDATAVIIRRTTVD